MKLTESQINAVKTLDRPLLVVAGAGAGKTRIIVEKLKLLLKQGHRPSEIVALTFTNKAADEMVKRLSGDDPLYFPYVCTFHSFCLKLLKQYPEIFGVARDITIIDDDDQEKICKEILRDHPLHDIKVRDFKYRINQIKLSDEDPDVTIRKKKFGEDFSVLFNSYENFLKLNHFLDFSDLLLYVVRGFKKNPRISDFFRNKFSYILVDEYQDTNPIQNKLLTFIYNGSNLTAVGDEDQSIYGFRGATIKNILNFEKTFEKPEIIYMLENFRSSQNIIKFSNFIISKNKQRREKELLPTRTEEGEVGIISSSSELEQAQKLIFTIQNLVGLGFRYDEIAVLYRANWQSGILEKAFFEAHIPYKIYGALSFYKRKEISSTFDYIAFILNPTSPYLLKKIINYPKRGIGEKSMDKFFFSIPEDYFMSLQLDFSLNGDKVSGFTGKDLIDYMEESGHNKIIHFAEQLRKMQSYSDSPSLFLEQLKIVMNFREIWDKEENLKGEQRAENYDKFVELAKNFEGENKKSGLADFYDQYILFTRDMEEDSKGVKLMTVHIAKGLEFPIVCVAGLTEGLFPYIRKSAPLDVDFEEERRLFYVASTRAKEKLFLFNHYYGFNPELTNYYPNYGKTSRFLDGVESLPFLRFIGNFKPYIKIQGYPDYEETQGEENRSALPGVSGNSGSGTPEHIPILKPGIKIITKNNGTATILEIKNLTPLLKQFRIKLEDGKEFLLIENPAHIKIAGGG